MLVTQHLTYCDRRVAGITTGILFSATKERSVVAELERGRSRSTACEIGGVDDRFDVARAGFDGSDGSPGGSVSSVGSVGVACSVGSPTEERWGSSSVDVFIVQ
ncbi:hypothetical protein COEREDRAFT_12396 [Coemansia reversa NRRL 1564]|uniref:Uncharacterized protein n=1 Tax=Coemansia reversa (strain ATCC 12441 / NRRL 1564) TaxID=763665 RepID=A0A2G5B0W9_COERN|nr:hypothetical protein COEREDRAFT_12396 [Coemansia reversa NRRL 1564]|eukprot:PIA12665.1 hypothetical protein COEREDRAFT_12396 [Coemansia reversa NRRL 1564]